MPDVAALRGPILPDPPTVLADRAAVGELPRLYALGVDLRDEAMVTQRLRLGRGDARRAR